MQSPILLQNLRDWATQIDKSKSEPTKFFDIGTTIEDNKRIQLRTFTEAQKQVCQILNIHHKQQSNRISKTLWEKEIINAVKRGVNFRTIYPSNCVLPQLLQTLNKKYPDKFQVKRCNLDFPRVDIIDTKKVLVKLVHQDAINFGGVFFVENEKLARNLQQIFDQFWEQAENC